MQRDVTGAVKYVEGQIARLLSGRVELWELVMTGGLWRVTGQQLEKAAAAAGEHTSFLLSLYFLSSLNPHSTRWRAVEGD
jgi:hypothetical protein